MKILRDEHINLTSLAERKRKQGYSAEHEELRAEDLSRALNSQSLRGHAREVIRQRLDDITQGINRINHTIAEIEARGIDKERQRYDEIAKKYSNIIPFDEYLARQRQIRDELTAELNILKNAWAQATQE
jgi:hypothetical protein